MEIACRFEYVNKNYNGVEICHYTCIIDNQFHFLRPHRLVGVHIPGKTDEQVSGAIIRKSRFENIHFGHLSTRFKNITFLRIHNCSGLTNFYMSLYCNFPNLVELSLENNDIEVLAEYKHLKNLKILSFRNNNINEYSSYFFYYFRNDSSIQNQMWCLDFRGNSKIDMLFDKKETLNSYQNIDAFIDKVVEKLEQKETVKFDHSAHVLLGIEKLWTQKIHYDFIIQLKEKELKVHKAILSAQAAFLLKILNKTLAKLALGK